MRRDLPLLALACACLLVVGCATAAPGPAPTASGSASADCTRSVDADTETGRARFDAGRLEEAVLYIRGLDRCPNALEHPAFLHLALDVYEEKGMLNEAWSAARILADLAIRTGDEAMATAVAERTARFAAAYALLVLPPDADPPEVAYAGPVIDDATALQLAQLAAGRGVRVDDGTYGFWLFPGTYSIGGTPRSLGPGDRVDTRTSK